MSGSGGRGSDAKGKARETGGQAEEEEAQLRSALEAGSNSGPAVKVERDAENLRLVEKLEMGPVEHGLGPEGDGRWASVEPNSQIRLRYVSSHTHTHTLALLCGHG